MKVAVSSQNFQTVTSHAGRARRFLIYEAVAGQEPVEIERLDLPKELSMHEFHGKEGPHPLDSVDVLISASFGEGFAQRMAERGLTAVTTDKTDPVQAVKAYVEMVAQGIAPAAPTLCSSHEHGHGHDHEHQHGHGHGEGHGHGQGECHGEGQGHGHGKGAHAHGHGEGQGHCCHGEGQGHGAGHGHGKRHGQGFGGGQILSTE